MLIFESLKSFVIDLVSVSTYVNLAHFWFCMFVSLSFLLKLFCVCLGLSFHIDCYVEYD
jgi:hypothetical protein